MTTAATLLADLNDRINDVSNAQVTEATKILYLNDGMRAMWPKIYRTVQDVSQVLAVDDYEYTIPTASDYGHVVRVDVESGIATNIYSPLQDYEIYNLMAGKVIRLKSVPAPYGARFRVTSVVPLTDFATSASVYDGPPNTLELPVWYALGIVASRRVEDRLDHKRYSTTASNNGVDPQEMMNVSQFAFAQFEMLLDRFQMPLLPEGG